MAAGGQDLDVGVKVVRQLRRELREARTAPGDMPLLGCSSAECVVARPRGVRVQTDCRCAPELIREAAEWWRRLAVFRGETIRAMRPGNADLRALWDVLGLSDGDTGRFVYASVDEVLGAVGELLRVNRDFADARSPRRREAWGEDNGPVVWWHFPVEEPPYVGTPLDDDFPDYVTHWTPLLLPQDPWMPGAPERFGEVR